MPRPRTAIPDEMLDRIIARLRAGTTAMIHEATRLGFTSRGPLRRALWARIGRGGYTELVNANREARTRVSKGEATSGA